MSWLPNLLTSLRLAAAPLVAWLLFHGNSRAALAIVVAAGLTDFLDGFTARRLHATSASGLLLDPIADKTLLVTIYITFAALRLIPLWLFCLVAGRDLMIVIGALLLRWLRGHRRFMPSPLGKVSTFFQIVFAAFVLLGAAFPNSSPRWLEQTALALAAAFTLLSALDYIRRGIAMARS